MLTVNPVHLSETQTVSFRASPTPLESSWSNLLHNKGLLRLLKTIWFGHSNYQHFQIRLFDTLENSEKKIWYGKRRVQTYGASALAAHQQCWIPPQIYLPRLRTHYCHLLCKFRDLSERKAEWNWMRKFKGDYQLINKFRYISFNN